MYFYPLGQQARYVADPDFGEDMIELFNKINLANSMNGIVLYLLKSLKK